MTTNLTIEEKLTIRTSNKGASDWMNEHSEDYWEKEFTVFKNLLRKGKIIELGSGAGRDAKTLISLGYDYIGTDVAKRFVILSKKLIPKGKFYTKSLYDLGFKENQFDGFWASAIFLHIPKNKINIAFSELKRVLKPESVGFISIKEGKGEEIIKEKFSEGKIAERFWAFYSKDEFDEVLKKNNFKILKFRKWVKSERTTWLIYFVKNIK